MTEEEWFTSVDWLRMWHFAIEHVVSHRKVRLLAVAACRELLHMVEDYRLLRMLALAEEWADETAQQDDEWWDRREDWKEEAAVLAQGLQDPLKSMAATAFSELANDGHKVGRAIEAVASAFGCPAMTAAVRPSHCPQVSRLIREVVGNPFRPITINPTWLTSTVVSLATGIYDEKAFDRMPILADALQDADCDNEDILNHLRGPGPHVKGCHVLDLLLGKS